MGTIPKSIPLSRCDAASAAVYLHTAAAELVSAEIGDRGLLASDLLAKIPRAMLKHE